MSPAYDYNPIVCRCLGVTEADVIEAIACANLETLDQVRRCTGAGDGCTGCHRMIRQYLVERSLATAS